MGAFGPFSVWACSAVATFTGRPAPGVGRRPDATAPPRTLATPSSLPGRRPVATSPAQVELHLAPDLGAVGQLDLDPAVEGDRDARARDGAIAVPAQRPPLVVVVRDDVQ